MSTKKPCGHPSWVIGSKLTFLNQYSDDWQKAVDISLNHAGHFYDVVTKHFIKKHGWHFDRWSDVDDIVKLDQATMDDKDSQEGLSEEEVEKRNKYFRDLRDVRHAFFGNWQHLTLNILGDSFVVSQLSQ